MLFDLGESFVLLHMKFPPILFLLVLFIAARSFSQNSGEVIYKYKFNGNELTERPAVIMYFTDYYTVIQNRTNLNPGVNVKEYQILNYMLKKSYQTARLKDGGCFTTVDSFVNYSTPELTGEYETIHGYKCRKATTVIRSNKFEIWFTTEAGARGTPLINVGPELGLVLKIVRNGSFEIYADSVKLSESGDFIDPDPVCGEMLDLPSYREKVTENNFTAVRIFTDEKINYGDTIVNPQGDIEGVTYRYSKGTVILKKVTLPENMQGNIVYAELTERSNGDAYDRTGTLFAIPIRDGLSYLKAFKNNMIGLPEYYGRGYKIEEPTKHYLGFTHESGYQPPVELMRFITPFGIGHYNSQVSVKGIEWEDSVTYKQDVTELLGTLQGEVWIGVFIGCYDNGGHRVSLKLKYHPDDLDAKDIPQKKYWIEPVINTVNIMEASGQEYPTIFLYDTVNVIVDIPAGIKNLKLRYISTGHGGWENGDEFNKKMNEIFVDGTLVYKYIPWRDDCGMYRKFNPASGNFSNGISSSDYSRSGWCPGSTALPVDIPLNGLKAGKHTFRIYIPMGKPEGSSFSAWNVSVVLIGEE